MKHTLGRIEAQRQDDPGGLLWWDLWSPTHGSIAQVSEGTRDSDRMLTARFDAERIEALWNAAVGMSTKRAKEVLKAAGIGREGAPQK